MPPRVKARSFNGSLIGNYSFKSYFEDKFVKKGLKQYLFKKQGYFKDGAF